MNELFMNSDNEYTFDIIEGVNSNTLRFISVDFISARIEDLKQQRLLLGNSLEMDNELRIRIHELINLINDK